MRYLGESTAFVVCRCKYRGIFFSYQAIGHRFKRACPLEYGKQRAEGKRKHNKDKSKHRKKHGVVLGKAYNANSADDERDRKQQQHFFRRGKCHERIVFISAMICFNEESVFKKKRSFFRSSNGITFS